ncbi:MAG TPA: HgcAB-like fusion protein [Streptosporangiaceae bacterium]|nr:HgcAB-like fusion protein [Streptosporangiaceae bacterium]
MRRAFERIWLVLWETFHIFFRHYNFPCKLGLRRVGEPDANSPVLISGNYTLTVYRLLRVLQGIDCWLLVANSRGSNVWCAAGMNEYTEHDIIDAVNVADLPSVVRHKRLIAPPYAAPGVDVRKVKQETGYRIIWGPTHLNDIPRYLTNMGRRTHDMVLVQFGFKDRMEQALSTSLAYCLTIAVGAIFFPVYVLGAMAIIFVVYCFAFAMWDFLPTERRWHRTLTVAALLGVPFGLFMGLRGWPASRLLIWEVILVVVVALMAMDGCGSSAVYKSTVAHWLRKGDYHSSFSPIIDPEMCTNCMDCQEVCPTDVFARRREDDHRMVVVRPESCIECLACVKQCDDEAIFNRSGQIKGDVKSIENLDLLMTRDWSHIAAEDRWIDWPTTVINGFSTVVEGKLAGRAQGPGDRA